MLPGNLQPKIVVQRGQAVTLPTVRFTEDVNRTWNEGMNEV